MPSYWEWQDDTDAWIPYHHKDNKLIESFYETGVSTMTTTELSFNEGYDTKYFYDFKKKLQKNMDSGRIRKLRRVDEGDDAEESGFVTSLDKAASFIGGGAKEVGKKKLAESDEDGTDVDEEPPTKKAKMEDGSSKATSKTPSAKSTGYTVPEVDGALAAAQATLGAQSRRKQAYDLGPVAKDLHGKNCFDRMLSNEKRMCGEWAVFYHSYSYAALLYEVQAAVAAVLFRFKSEYATLPRLLKQPYSDFPDAASLVKFFPKFTGRDHDPRFRAVAISGTSSLLAGDSEAPPKNIFLSGYSCADLSFVGVLENLLVSCGVPAKMKQSLAKKIIEMSAGHGLDCSQFKGKGCKSGKAGHMLQIFIKRTLVNRFVYAALPFGVKDTTRPDLEKYLQGAGPIQGQIRLVTNPSAFMRGSAVRMFVYSADQNFHVNRPAFQKELTALLNPIIGSTEVRTKAAEGIYDGNLPGWFSATDLEDTKKAVGAGAGKKDDSDADDE